MLVATLWQYLTIIKVGKSKSATNKKNTN